MRRGDDPDASTDRRRSADGWTLVLDEIGELPLDTRTEAVSGAAGRRVRARNLPRTIEQGAGLSDGISAPRPAKRSNSIRWQPMQRDSLVLPLFCQSRGRGFKSRRARHEIN